MPTEKNQQTIDKLTAILKYTFVIVPIAAGLDKFLNLLTNWEMYLAPFMIDILPFSPSTFMVIVGIIEIVAGFIVLIRTKIGAYIVSAWLALIAINLLLGGQYLDVAVRDIVMAISAYVLAELADPQSDEI